MSSMYQFWNEQFHVWELFGFCVMFEFDMLEVRCLEVFEVWSSCYMTRLILELKFDLRELFGSCCDVRSSILQAKMLCLESSMFGHSMFRTLSIILSERIGWIFFSKNSICGVNSMPGRQAHCKEQDLKKGSNFKATMKLIKLLYCHSFCNV